MSVPGVSSFRSTETTQPFTTLLQDAEAVFRMDVKLLDKQSNPVQLFCHRLLGETTENILNTLPILFDHLDSQNKDHQMIAREIVYLIGQKETENVSHAIIKFKPGKFLQMPGALRSFCKLLSKVNGEQRPEALGILLQVLKDASKNPTPAIRMVACDMLSRSMNVPGADEIAFSAAANCVQKKSKEDGELAVGYFTDLFNDGYFVRHPVHNSLLEKVIEAARPLLHTTELEPGATGHRFYQSLIEHGDDSQVKMIPESTVKKWRNYAIEHDVEGRFSDLVKRLDARVKA